MLLMEQLAFFDSSADGVADAGRKFSRREGIGEDVVVDEVKEGFVAGQLLVAFAETNEGD